jgi:hypothetical protein
MATTRTNTDLTVLRLRDPRVQRGPCLPSVHQGNSCGRRLKALRSYHEANLEWLLTHINTTLTDLSGTQN